VRFLKIRLQGTRTNRDGLGAIVTVGLPSGRQITKVADGKSGYLSQSDLPLYFGLADAEGAAQIRVRWSSGRVQHIAGPITPNQTLEIVER